MTFGWSSRLLDASSSLKDAMHYNRGVVVQTRRCITKTTFFGRDPERVLNLSIPPYDTARCNSESKLQIPSRVLGPLPGTLCMLPDDCQCPICSWDDVLASARLSVIYSNDIKHILAARPPKRLLAARAVHVPYAPEGVLQSFLLNKARAANTPQMLSMKTRIESADSLRDSL